MLRDNGKGILLEDFSGTLIVPEADAPLTTDIPTQRFVERVRQNAGNPRFTELGSYLEHVFKGKTPLYPYVSPHRYLEPTVNSVKRWLRLDAWHVLERDEIMKADVGKASEESRAGLRSYVVSEKEVEDLRRARSKFNIVGTSGIIYAERLAALEVMGDARGYLDMAVFRMNPVEDTGLEVKLAVGAYFDARKAPGVKQVSREDCKLTAVVLTSVTDVSLVHVQPGE